VYMTWRNFGTNNLYLRQGESLLQYLTACSERHESYNRIGKTLVRPQHVDIGRVWTIHHCPLKNGHSFADGDGNEILFRDRDMENLSHHDTHIRINHYFYRDESYMRYNKLPRVMSRGLSEEQVYEQNRRFMKEKDYRILRLIGQHYLRQWKSIWQK
ncbi:MAG: hypothetical protein KDK65_06295, partial [Chlamydiia bacterium]|nr:hypothetical protein [Chlamydiia bacterium]